MVNILTFRRSLATLTVSAALAFSGSLPALATLTAADENTFTGSGMLNISGGMALAKSGTTFTADLDFASGREAVWKSFVSGNANVSSAGDYSVSKVFLAQKTESSYPAFYTSEADFNAAVTNKVQVHAIGELTSSTPGLTFTGYGTGLELVFTSDALSSVPGWIVCFEVNYRINVSTPSSGTELRTFAACTKPFTPAPSGGGVVIITPNPIVVDSPTPYIGPVLQAPGAAKPVASGSKVVIPGSNLTGVSKATIDGKDAAVKVNSAGELELTVPSGLAPGTYDLVITSDSGVLTVQDGIRVSGSAVITESVAKPSVKLKDDNTVKVYVFAVAGAGKVQIKLNGQEVAWVNTTNPEDPKLSNGYLVRTLELAEGKNVIEVFVDGKRVDRKAYTN